MTAVGALCAAVSLSACGRPAAEAPPGGSEVVAAEAAARQLYVRIAGTAAQQAAGQRRQHERMQQATRTCMREAGFDYQVPAFLDLDAGGPPLDIMLETDWLAPLGRTGLLEDAQRTATVADAVAARDGAVTGPYAQLSPADKRRYAAAITTCARAAAVHEGSARPAAVYDLLGRFHAMVRAVDQGVDGGAYRDCMAADGFEMSGHREVVAAVTERIPPLEAVPRPGRDGGEPWAAAAAYERRVTAADARCRAGERATAYARLAPELAAFERENGAALAAVGRDWSTIAGAGS